MNSRKKGSLKAISIIDWFATYQSFDQFIYSMNISDQEHELWYGDKKEAAAMEKEQLIKKFHFSLEFVNLSHIVHSANLTSNFKPKELKKFSKPIWPAFLHMAQHSPFGINMKKFFGNYKDMELVAYAIGQNPISDSKIQQINLSKNVISKEGAKLLAPSLEYNKNLISLDLSHTKIGVSGMV